MKRASFVLLALLVGCVAQPLEPVLLSVSPESVVSGRGGVLTLNGEHFLPVGTLDFDRPSTETFSTSAAASLLGAADVRVALTDVRWLDARTIEATVPAGVTVGQWTVELTTPRGATLSLPGALRVTATDEDGGCATLSYVDADDDGFGDPATEALVCTGARVLVGGDCDDGDPLVAPDRDERCNGRDDDCDGLRDEEGCDGGGLRFVRDHVLDGNDNDFLSASAFGPDSLWIAGGAKLFLHEPDAGFVDKSASCPGTMNAVWADAEGRAFVAGGTSGAGRLTTATRAQGCASAKSLPQTVGGLVGFPSGDGGARVEVVLRDGRRASWDGVGDVEVFGTVVPGVQLFDVHGVSPTSLYAVGATTGMPQRPVVLRLQGDGGFVSEPLPTQGVPNGHLNGVWAVSETEVVAVGNTGTVLRRINGAWERIPPPSQAHYTTVRAFSIDRFYLSTVYGYVRQWSGQWTLHYTDQQPVRDLTAFDESRFWLVGDNGLLINGPQ